MSFDPSAPVIVRTAQQTWREPDAGRTPLDALQAVADKALAGELGTDLKNSIDCLATVRFIMDTDPNLAALLPRNPGLLLAERLGIAKASFYQTDIGGNTPQFLVNHFAGRLAAGEFKAVLISGAEILNTFFTALKTGGDISQWRDRDTVLPQMIGEEKEGLNSQESAHGLFEPVNTYPLFESALRHRNGEQPDSTEKTTADLFASMSAVAARNPNAWQREAQDAQQIARVHEGNRYIGFPYTKSMNALLSVDMAAAVVITTAGHAKALGIPESDWIYLRAGTDLNEVWHPSERPDLDRSPALGIAVKKAMETAQLSLDEIDCFDIYSCFPSALRIACDEIGLSPMDSRGVTVTGGLPFFGGPGNNYSLHAIAETVERLKRDGGNGLVTANGLYLTKHSVGIYSSKPGTAPWQAISCETLQQAINAGPRRQLAEEPQGEITLEAATVAFSRKGPKLGIVIGSNTEGDRVIANIPGDAPSINRLLDQDVVGMTGKVQVLGGKNVFSFD